MACRQRGRDNLPLGIHANVQFLPALELLLTMFLAVPFPLTTDLQAATVNDQSYRSLGARSTCCLTSTAVLRRESVV